MIILTLNCGSSSVKYLLYDWKNKTELVRGIIERVGEKSSKITQQTLGEEPLSKTIACPDHETAIKEISNLIFSSKKLPDRSSVKGVGHRVVHGGEEFNKPTVITPNVLKKIKSLIELAPLHNPPNIAGIEGAMKAFPDIPHVAIFDTAYHQTMPEEAYLYAVPYVWYEKYGIRRFGFHGTSHSYVSKKTAEYLKINKYKMITMHIGAGVSVTAIKNGKSIDTSMGFTPLEGLPMATRSGNIDPTVMTYISEKTNMDVEKVLDILNKKSGLLGITGKFTDRRDIIKSAQEGDKLCQIA
ncbi:MAG: acetate/propionate family kinase, partial [bacterium]